MSGFGAVRFVVRNTLTGISTACSGVLMEGIISF